MTDAPSNPPLITRWWVRLLISILGFVALLLIATSVKVIETAAKQEVHPADAIVVFGAAEYAGHPSPVLRARLDHALDLFQRGVAPVVITTGGAADDPHYSEGGVGRDYLMHHGVPERSLIAETQGRDTSESAERVAVIMRANNLHSCVAVSDPYHLFRIKHMLASQGVAVYASPRAEARPLSLRERALTISREALSYTLWKMHVT